MVGTQKAAVGEGATPAKRRKLSEETTSGSSEAPQQTEDQSKEGTTIGGYHFTHLHTFFRFVPYLCWKLVLQC